MSRKRRVYAVPENKSDPLVTVGFRIPLSCRLLFEEEADRRRIPLGMQLREVIEEAARRRRPVSTAPKPERPPRERKPGSWDAVLPASTPKPLFGDPDDDG